MSTSVLIIAFPDARAPVELAESLIGWLVHRELAEAVPEDRDGVLLHPPGPRCWELGGAMTLQPWTREDSGVMVDIEAQLWFDWDDDRETVAACPLCGHEHNSGTVDRLLERYAGQASEGGFPCSSCLQTIPFPDWEFGEGVALAPLALTFYNWATGLLPSVRAELADLAGGRVLEIVGSE